MSPRYLSYLVLILCLGFSNCTTIFNANFNSQPVGPPATDPPGNPSGDAMTFSNGVTVVTPSLITTNALQVERVNQGTYVEFIPADHQLTPNYTVFFRGYVPTAGDRSHLTMTVKGNSGTVAFQLRMAGGKFTLISGDGTEEVGSYTTDQLYVFFLTMIVDAGSPEIRISVLQGGSSVVNVSGKPFVDAAFNRLTAFRMEYPQPLLEAFPGIIVVDDVLITKKREVDE
ncbi:hypothetical protein [Flavilitoribacter nigricans]|uniref:Lipoprotein n=1 Tax=Flavilitoribacter nigricans (strain ATCC 23147 / DSM 23189 / NBRC 102662 / NCIMB 1420 / SS-2) TaxID=1122177 RepID=A0A2D0MXJ5_FLAN2|nr:hypothetical protein [Flavilitoribacter nigricans]PHN00856.1 hypothetical protein CRP01_40180 [Flavilitoribacter nigricans DSM 23189 = NBRC 102662]